MPSNTSLYTSGTGANVSSNNLTTLYNSGAGSVITQLPYGNANVERFLNLGTDGANTIENVIANGNIEANGFFVGDGGYLSNITATTVNANFANFAGNVTNSAQPNITSVGTLVNLTVTGNITSTTGIFNGDGSGLTNVSANTSNTSNVSNANSGSSSVFYPVFVSGTGNVQLNIDNVGNTFQFQPSSGTVITEAARVNYVTNDTTYSIAETIQLDGSNNSIKLGVTGAANSVVLSNTLANFTLPVQTPTIIANAANLTGSYNINSAGYYFPDEIPLTTPLNYNANTPGFLVSGTVTTGSNLITGVSLYDSSLSNTFSLTDWGSYLTNQRVAYTDGVGTYTDYVFPIGTFISNVDAANSQITVSNNSSVTASVPLQTGALLSNASTNTYLTTQQPVFALATSTDATSNAVTLNGMTQFTVYGATTGYPVQFLGTGFGNITVGTQYYVGNIDVANSQITISTSNTGSPDLQLTTATGNLLAVSALDNQTIKPLNGGYYFAGPWSTNPPSISNFTEAPSGTIIGNATFTTSNAFVKPVDFNSNVSFPSQLSGQFTRVQNGLLVSDSEYGTATLFGGLDDPFPLAGIGALHTGLEANAVNGRTNLQIVNYTDNGADSASITNPGNPPAFSFTAFTGNVNTNINDNYLRSGRTIGRIAWYGAMQNNGVRYVQPGSSPVAGVYVQALGDWNNSVNANLPMVMAFQYSPLNAAGSTPNYQRINRTFLQAANNTTTIGGATNIEFRPLARGTNATNNRSPSALGNVSINPQKFVDISGYTTGDAVSNGAGALLNVTTTASTWNGNVALRLSRTVGNTANMEFRLPTANANTMVLVDNASGNTIATFTNGNANFNGIVTATSFTGDGGNLSNINASNITGIVANANYANFSGTLINGTSNVSIPSANGNINLSVNNNSNVVQISSDTNALVNVFPLITQTNALRFNSIGSPQQDCRLTFARYETSVSSSTSVQPNANVGTLIFFAHNGTGISSTFPAIIRAKVDAAYTANTANIPYGLQFIVAQTTQTGTANTGFTHNFYSNGNVAFAKTVNAANIILSGNANITGTANITGNSNVGNLGASFVTVTGNVVSANIQTGNASFGSGSSNLSVQVTGDKTPNSSLSLTNAQFSVITDTPSTLAYTPFRFNYYDNNAAIAPNRNFRARGTFGTPTSVQVGDDVALTRYVAYGDSGNPIVNLFDQSVVITQNNLAGNVLANFNITPTNTASNIVLGTANTYATNLILSGNINITGNAIVNSNTTIYSNGLVNATQFSTANTNIYANGAVNTNGELTADNVKIDTNGFMKLSSYTAAGLTAITGQIGWMAAVSDSAGGGNPNGMIAFWDTTNARWSYVHDNSAV